MAAVEVGVAVGAEHEDARPPQLAREVREQLQRGAVRPVQVVEHDHQRHALGDPAQEARHRVEEPELASPRSPPRGGSGRFGKSVAQVGKMRCSSTAYGSHSLRRTSSAFWSR